MLALDWDVFLNSMKTTTLLEAGIKDMRNYSIAQLLHDLSLGSTRTAYENFPVDCFNKEKSHNISDYVDDLKRYGIVKDVIGILKFYYGTKIYFPTFVLTTIGREVILLFSASL